MKKTLLPLLLLTLTLTGCSLFTKGGEENNPGGGGGGGENPPIDDTVPDKNHPRDTINDSLSKKDDQFNALFNYENKIEIKLKFTNQSITKLAEYAEGDGNDNFVKNEMYHPAEGTITINGVSNKYYELGVRMKGNTSRDTEFIDDTGHFVNNHYCHFKVSFSQTFDNKDDNDYYINPWTNSIDRTNRDDRKFGGMKKIDLKWNRNEDESFTKEAYALNAFREEGVLAQHSNLVQLTLETESDSRTMVYQVYEAVDKRLMKQALSKDNDGDLYKCCYTDMGKANLTSYSNNKIGIEGTRYRPVYNLKSNEDTSTHELMKNFIDTINSMKNRSGEEFYDAISPLMDVDNFLKYSALCYIFGLPDDLRNNANNYYIYFNKDNKALFIPYDNDRCLGIRNGWDKDLKNVSWDDPYAKGYDGFNECPLILRLISGGSNNSHPVHQDSKDRYYQYVLEYASKYLDVNAYQAFTNKFYYSSKNISTGGNNNDSFEVYASMKIATLN